MNESQELLDLVDNTDRVVGTILRGDIRQLFETTGHNVRYACCFIQNAKGELWIPRRTAHKTIAPNGLDFAASEHVQAGESYLEAMVRGLFEELHLEIAATNLQSIGKLLPDDRRPYFSMIYQYILDDVPTYNPDDFTSYEWLTPVQLVQRLEAGEVAKQNLLPAVELLMKTTYADLNQR